MVNNLLDFPIGVDVSSEEDMEWVEPQYSHKDVNWAGNFIAREISFDSNEMERAFSIIENFRAAHAFPLNTLQNRLRILTKLTSKSFTVAQRLKRLPSTLLKLRLIPTLDLWDMQDIGGCRSVVGNVNSVNKLVDLFKKSSIKHSLVDHDDYISNPKLSGYRSRHLIYRYYSDKNPIYNGFKIEVQIRSPLQHAWATAVETVDAFTRQALKSSKGDPGWNRFFQLMGSEMARIEKTPLIPQTPTEKGELHKELADYASKLNVIQRFRGFTTALQVTRRASALKWNAAYFLLTLNGEKLNIMGYSKSQPSKAIADYALREKQTRNQDDYDAVLVNVRSLSELKRAYPNYFADTEKFISVLKEAIVDEKAAPLFH